MSAKIPRRVFLKQGGMALAAMTFFPTFGPKFLQNIALAEEVRPGERKKIVVCLFQRGAVDGLSMVVPYGDASYYEYRTSIALARPRFGSTSDGVINLDGFFGLHPSLSALLPLYNAGHLAPIHACGSPAATRSHFDAQDFMESGTTGDQSSDSGWLARAVMACPEDRARKIRSVALTAEIPRSLQGDPKAIAFTGVDSEHFGGGHGGVKQGAEVEYEEMYRNSFNDVLRSAGTEAFDAIGALNSIDPKKYTPDHGAEYPKGHVGEALKQVAQLIKADLGLRVAFADCSGWDTHVNQGGVHGQLSNNLKELGDAVAAFFYDMGEKMSDVVLVTMSEFGRTARQNGSGGTDHGHGTCFFVLGGNVRGGKVLGTWPGLYEGALYEGRDLAVTTDYRDVLAEITMRHLGVRDASGIFPRFTISPGKFRNIMPA